MSGSTTKDFFNEQNSKSHVKSKIVVSFFETYFSIINNTDFSKNGIYYIDLFSGPGIYKNGDISTPMQILNTIDKFSKDDAVNKLKLVFNDENTEFAKALKTNITNHPVYSRLKTKPVVLNKKTSNVDLSIYTQYGCPIFSFVDPWGYKDVSFSQIHNLVRPIGSDCILFFNVNRILQDINKPSSNIHMNELFGKELPNALDVAKDPLLSQKQKGESFVKLFSRNLYDMYFTTFKNLNHSLFVLPFAFRQDNANKTSHYIVFITKNYKAITEMKKIMVANSNSNTTVLAYDEKDEYTISFFNRYDNIYLEVKNLIIDMLSNNKKLLRTTKNINGWAEYIDRYSMSKNSIITPYTLNEIKNVIKSLDKKGYITIYSEVKRTRITNTSLFSFNSELIGE